jgi:hypothetical protein
VQLHNFNPNSIVQATIFAAVCEGYLGVPPHWNLWLHLFKAKHFTKATESGGSRKMVRAGGCTLQVRQEHLSLYIPAQLTSSNRGWQEGWSYLRNDNSRLPLYTSRVMMERLTKWRWGIPSAEQPRMQPLLDSLKRLRDGGLTATGVVTAFHRRRVLLLMAWWLCLHQMEEGSPLEGCQMSDTSLTAVEATRRVTYTVSMGFTLANLNQVKMCSTRGYISLVSTVILLVHPRFFIGFLFCY